VQAAAAVVVSGHIHEATLSSRLKKILAPQFG
jgi:hypothetical protein